MTRNAYRQGKKQVNVVMSDVLHRQLITAAASRGLTVQTVVVEAVREWIMAQTPSAAAEPMDSFAVETVGPKPKIVDMDVYQQDGSIIRTSFVMPYENVPFEETP